MLCLSNATAEGDRPSAIRLRRYCAILADTGWEPKAVYEHQDWLMSPKCCHSPSIAKMAQDDGASAAPACPPSCGANAEPSPQLPRCPAERHIRTNACSLHFRSLVSTPEIGRRLADSTGTPDPAIGLL